MNSYRLLLLCAAASLFLFTTVLAENTIQPLWTEPGTVGGQLYGIVISADGSTIITGGDQVISLTRDGRKRWSGWSATSLDINRQGDYILTGKGTELRLLSGAGTLVWDRNMEIAVRDVSLAPDLSFIAAAGGGKIRTLTFSGEGIASNDTMTINRVRIIPSGDRLLLSTSRDIQLMDPKLNREWADENLTQNLIAVAPDGSSFVTAFSNRIRMYTGNGTILWDKRFPVGDAQAMAYSRDGTTIVLALSENLLVLDHTGRQIWMANATDIINGVAVSDDGNTIAAGSLDRNLYIFNHAGTRLGTFTVKNAIKPDSVGVTGDGQLIVLVAPSAVYGFSRSSFVDETRPVPTLTETVTEIPEETTTIAAFGTTTRKVTTRPQTLPTPYPVETATPESPLSPDVVFIAVLLLVLASRPRRK